MRTSRDESNVPAVATGGSSCTPAGALENRPMARPAIASRSSAAATARHTATKPLALVLVATALLATPARVCADATIDPFQLPWRINHGPLCTRTQVLGLCWCGATPCGYRVRMYVPVAFVETVRAPGDSLLGLPLGDAGVVAAEALGTESSSHSALDNTAEAHAWLLGDAAWMLSAQPPCLSCKPSDARTPAAPPSVASDLLCGATSLAVEALKSNPVSSVAPVLARLAYASEFDAVNWRTGCRDLLAIDSWAQAPYNLRRWGSLQPRQMRDLGTAPLVYSAKTGYRALSIARDQLGTFPFPVDLAARMQQAYPAVSTCFDVGEQPLPQAPSSDKPVRTSADGRYGWFYWRPVTCCVGLESLAMCPKVR
jgi:hypothetical protein